MDVTKHDSSFRDPDGYIFAKDGKIFRRINSSYFETYRELIDSGLYQHLVDRGALVSHAPVEPEMEADSMVIEPELIPYISYPYEWSFSELKDAALLTLDVQSAALEHGMSLKDASAFNIQFRGATPVFIDTLSFEKLNADTPWVAYRQFCQHFLAPLALMAHSDVRLRHLLAHYIDGIPLDLASQLLPRRTKFKYSLLAHIHLHAKSQQRHENDGAEGSTTTTQPKMTMARHNGLIESLKSAVRKLSLKEFTTEWGDYYTDTNYSSAAMSHKEETISAWLANSSADVLVHDLGANTGRFSALASDLGRTVISHDIDENAVERHYLELKSNKRENRLPLLLDLTNPTAAQGWRSKERDSFVQRTSNDFVMALALIHHLAISNNVPLPELAKFFAEVSETLIIEFVPKSDSQVRRLLASREDIFPNYNIEGFEEAFAAEFTIQQKVEVRETDRVLYLLQRKAA